MTKRILALFTVLLLLGCASSAPTADATGDSSLEGQDDTQQSNVDLQVKGDAPSFQATTINGEDVSLAQYMQTGKPLLVYFTASWCPICAQNWPHLDTMHEEYGDQINIVAISIDPSDTAEVLQDLAQEENLSYQMVPGSPGIMRDFGVNQQATTVGVNTDGKIVFKEEKKALSEDTYRDLVESLIR